MTGFSLLLECETCSTINYLDPFSFWYFKGKTKCAGCDAVVYIEIDNGQRTTTQPAEGKPDKLPGYAQSKDYTKDYRTPDKVSLPVYARPPDAKHGPTYRNVRGNPIAAGPLNPEDLVGSRPRFILEGRPYQ